MTEQELNKKLAEWVGKDDEEFLWYVDNVLRREELNFTQSLDACFKWLVPKLDKKVEGTNRWITGLDITFSYGAHQGGIICGVQAEVLVKSVHNTICDSISETPALALCLAIEKLIDGGK